MLNKLRSAELTIQISDALENLFEAEKTIENIKADLNQANICIANLRQLLIDNKISVE